LYFFAHNFLLIFAQVRDYPGAQADHCIAENRTNKLSTDAPSSEKTTFLLFYAFMAYKYDRYCHIVTEPFFQRYYAWQITGHRYVQIINFFHLLRQNGLEGMWNRYVIFVYF
jgi:hypothetical protein